ncbi:techylectin-5B, partial [Drosophila erecta]|uniref:techylectin-5B n=1 Tax=Drosophila erecta TaxID=7220 RepID=UPI000F07177E
PQSFRNATAIHSEPALEALYKVVLALLEENQHSASTESVQEISSDLNSTGWSGRHRSHCPTYPAARGIYTIQVLGLEPFQVSCDAEIAGSGWTVIARRTSNKLNFVRSWKEYKKGFGQLNGDFFIGLDKLHVITKSQPHELYIHLEDFEGQTRYAHYDEFFVESENKFYALTKLGGFTGDAGDSMMHNRNQNFSTFDRDNDGWHKNCAEEYMGAWWHVNCTLSNLFGVYVKGHDGQYFQWKGIVWQSWRSESYSYKVMQMMVRPKCYCSR